MIYELNWMKIRDIQSHLENNNKQTKFPNLKSTQF